MTSWPDPYALENQPQTYVYLPPQHRSSTAHLVFAWLAAVLTGGYMLPWAIGATRNRTNCAATALVNFFLGWTLIGWVVALVMACGSEPQQPVIVRTVPGLPYAPPAPPYAPARSYAPALAYPPAPGQNPALTSAYPAYPADPGGQPTAAEVTMPLPAYQDRPLPGDGRSLR